MSKKDMESRLGNTVRQAKGEPLAEQKTVSLHQAKPKPASRVARQGDQTPPADANDPWRNLYPERIWPD